MPLRSSRNMPRAIIARAANLTMLILVPCLACASLHTGSNPTALTGTSSDGLNLASRLDPAAARQAAAHALRANGFAIDDGASTGWTIRSRARRIATDTSVVVAALVTPVDLAPTKSMVTLSATFSVAHTRTQDRQLLQSAGMASSPWRVLGAVRDSLRSIVAPAP